MVISDMSADWLKTPGIATRSIKEIEAVPKESRWRKAVVLGFRGTDADQKIVGCILHRMSTLILIAEGES